MIPPITREEKYIYEIVGAGKTAPEKPLTKKEIFYAAILGEDRTVPRPITNAEKYLAALAGAYSEALPSPTTRIEKFLAKAAGMDVKTPVPVTREEIFWDNYSAVQKIEGIPPIVFTSNGKALKNYRIYGNTVDGESVGDLVAEGEHAGQCCVPVTVEGKNLFNFGAWSGTLRKFYPNGYYSIVGEHEIVLTSTQNNNSFTLPYRASDNGYRIPVLPNTAYTLSWISDSDNSGLNYVLENGLTESAMIHTGNNCSTKTMSFITSATTSFVTLRFAVADANTTIRYSSIQFEIGLAATSYESYREPITTNLYLSEPIKMGEYVDFVKQKQYFVDGSYADVTLPELQTISGTNILSVNTQVQPSKVYVEGKIKTV